MRDGVTVIEPATDDVPSPPNQVEMLASIAISLKRIADTLDGNLSAGGFANLEQLAWQMGRAFESGRGAA